MTSTPEMEIPGGWGSKTKVPSVEVMVFFGTTHYILFLKLLFFLL